MPYDQEASDRTRRVSSQGSIRSGSARLLVVEIGVGDRQICPCCGDEWQGAFRQVLQYISATSNQ